MDTNALFRKVHTALEQVDSTDPEAVSRTLNNLSEWAKDGSFSLIVKILRSKNDNFRRRAARALGALALKNEATKSQILSCEPLPILVELLDSEKEDVQYEAIRAIGSFAGNSPEVAIQILVAGALQPVINLFSSTSSATKIEAANLVGRFAYAHPDCKAHLVQRGAVYPLIEMLQSSDGHLKEMSSYALGMLAADPDTHNQAGIARAGAIPLLLDLLDSSSNSLQRNGVIVLFGLALSEDIVVDFIRAGGVQKLLGCDFVDELTRNLVLQTIQRLEERIAVERVLDRMLLLMSTSDMNFQQQISLALACLCSANVQNRIFVDNNGLALLWEPLQSTNSKLRGYACKALCKLVEKATSLSGATEGPPSPKEHWKDVYDNSPEESRVTFLVEDEKLYAEKTSLAASSSVFAEMLKGGFGAGDINIENISRNAFYSMMSYIHTGKVQVDPQEVPGLLRAASQYCVRGLKRYCENILIQGICANNVQSMYDLSCECAAVSLRHACFLFLLKNFRELDSTAWYRRLLRRLVPEIRDYVVKML